MFVLLLLTFLTVSCTAVSNYDEEYTKSKSDPFKGPVQHINFQNVVKGVDNFVTTVAPTATKTAAQFQKLGQKEKTATGMSGIEYFVDYINDFLSEYIECLSQINLMINCFNNIKLTYSSVNQAVLPNGILNAIIQALNGIVAQENIIIKQMGSIRTVAEGLIQNDNINVLGINILPIAVTTVSQNFGNIGSANYVISNELNKITWYNKFWSAELQQAKYTKDNSILVMITNMIDQLSLECKQMGDLATDLSSEIVEDVVDNELNLPKFYQQLTSMMADMATEFNDIGKDMIYAGTGLKLILTPENGVNANALLPLIAAKMAPPPPPKEVHENEKAE